MERMDQTPGGLRIQIGIFGRTNTGKSSIMNMLTGQDAAIVSPVPGTTTDPVRKSMELGELGPCLFIDTPGTYDGTALEDERTLKMEKVMRSCDIALIVMNGSKDIDGEAGRIGYFKDHGIPFIVVFNKMSDEVCPVDERFDAVCVNALTGEGGDVLREKIIAMGRSVPARTLLGDMVRPGDTVMLIMPQDGLAPKGRLILPQVMTTRELLDKHAVIISVQPEEMETALKGLGKAPDIIITDSQAFGYVSERCPSSSRLTSFSILMAGLKGDIAVYTEGAKRMMSLKDGDKILIAESCTHAPADEDIGRVKIPDMIRKKLGIEITTEVAAGSAFPDDLGSYSLILQCGGCMAGRKAIMSRIESARDQGVPITNYGIAIAKLTGILDRCESFRS